MTETGKLSIDVPRDRQSSFDPQLIAKYQRRFPGFDDKIVSMYARGMSTREITGHLHDLYGIDVSPDLISTVTDAVLDEVATWQQRPLDPVYPLVFFDAIRVKIRDEGMVRNTAIHIALGVRADGAKEVLGLWLEQNEGAKFWLRVMNELGTVRISVCGWAVEHYAAMALMKRSPKMTANWALAMDHSRGGIFHSFSDLFKIR
jgi:putative transposase